jgi:hypothetical protein
LLLLLLLPAVSPTLGDAGSLSLLLLTVASFVSAAGRGQPHQVLKETHTRQLLHGAAP